MNLTQIRHNRKIIWKLKKKKIRNKYAKQITERQKLEKQKSERDVGNAIYENLSPQKQERENEKKIYLKRWWFGVFKTTKDSILLNQELLKTQV